MPTYDLHLHDRGRVFRDEEGDVLADEGLLWAHTPAMARDLIARTRSSTIRDWFDCHFEVTDAAGRTVLVMPFGDTVEAPEVDGRDR